jgi:hypothetical protein
MKVQVLQRGGIRNPNIEAKAREFAARLMSTRLCNTLSIRIEMRASKLAADMAGKCVHAPIGSQAVKTFTIVLDRDMTWSDQLSYLAHEMKHVEQVATGRLQMRFWKTDRQLHVRWNGAEMGPIAQLPYWTRPWEVEAREFQAQMDRPMAIAA